jgi:glycerate-2-kinase
MSVSSPGVKLTHEEKKMKDVVRYSEAFKRRNGIRGATTLHEWIKKYGRKDILVGLFRGGGSVIVNRYDDGRWGFVAGHTGYGRTP